MRVPSTQERFARFDGVTAGEDAADAEEDADDGPGSPLPKSSVVGMSSSEVELGSDGFQSAEFSMAFSFVMLGPVNLALYVTVRTDSDVSIAITSGSASHSPSL